MHDDAHSFGPYRFLRELGAARIGPGAAGAGGGVRRFAAIHERTQAPHVVYALHGRADRLMVRRFLAGMGLASGVRHGHLLGVEAYALCPRRGRMIVGPYTGDHGGLLTLDALLRQKGGRVAPGEALRAAWQLLDAAACGHAAGVADGTLDLHRVQVDPHGRLRIELFGVWRAMSPSAAGAHAEAARADTLALAGMVHRLVTGVAPSGAAASLLVPGVSAAWDAWFDVGLRAIDGYASAAAALAALPRHAAGGDASTGVVRALLGRLRGLGTRRPA